MSRSFLSTQTPAEISRRDRGAIWCERVVTAMFVVVVFLIACGVFD